MLRRASEQEHGEFVGEEAEEQRRIDLSAGSRYRGQQSLHLQEGTRTSSPMEKSKKTEGTEKTKGAEETEESEDSYYIPDDYYSEESGYDSDIFKKCWEDDF
jgi:hypothetical protein